MKNVNLIFSEENLNMKLLKKLKQSGYSKDKLLLKLIDLIENDARQINQTKEDQIPARLDYVEKREIDRSTLYSFNDPFQLVQADIAKVEFLGKLVTTPSYALLIVGLCSSTVYVYPMNSRKQLLQWIKEFYDKVQNKRININMRLVYN